jgi:hypothetical protein
MRLVNRDDLNKELVCHFWRGFIRGSVLECGVVQTSLSAAVQYVRLSWKRLPTATISIEGIVWLVRSKFSGHAGGRLRLQQ